MHPLAASNECIQMGRKSQLLKTFGRLMVTQPRLMGCFDWMMLMIITMVRIITLGISITINASEVGSTNDNPAVAPGKRKNIKKR